MRILWSPSYEVSIGPHVFPTAKYRLVRNLLLDRGAIEPGQILLSEPVSWEDLARVHTLGYLEKIRTGSFSWEDERLLELPFSESLREASLLCCGGTLRTAREALREGVSAHLGGGFHHAFPDHGEGFCLLNDVAVAMAALLASGEVERGAVVDLDVHHGNGTAAIFAREPRVFTLSVHQEMNYPYLKPPSDLDVGLPDGTGDEEYLAVVESALQRVMEQHRPELVIYLAGADPFREDQLGGLALSREGLEARDRSVMEICGAGGAAISLVLAGGYARRLEDTVSIHTRSVEVALEAWEIRRRGPRG